MLRNISRVLKMVDPKVVPNIKLPSGDLMPQFGLGTWKSKPGEVKQAVIDAINSGYRHIDTAFVYGNEKEIGEAIAEKIADGTVKREDLFIVTKLWSNSHRPDTVKKACEVSLDLLKLKYVDLYLIHWPQAYRTGDKLFPTKNGEPFNPTTNGDLYYDDIDYVDTYLAMEKLKDEGLVRNIGLSNFNTYQIKRILEKATQTPATNQVEAHIYLNQTRLGEFCKEKNISLTAYCPLGSPDRPWAHDAEPKPMQDPNIVKLAEKYNKSPAQVLIRFLLQLGYICIPKSVTASRIKANIEVFDFKLTDEEFNQLKTLNKNYRFCSNAWDAKKESFHYPLEPCAEGGVEF